jgi:hypothetical protein
LDEKLQQMAAHASGYEYDTRETGLYTFDTVMGVCCGDDDERVVQYCMLVGLLRANKDCPTCAQSMALKRQGTQWRCSKRACDVTLSVRHDSVFFHSKPPLRKLVKLLFFFATRLRRAISPRSLQKPSRPGTIFAVATAPRS